MQRPSAYSPSPKKQLFVTEARVWRLYRVQAGKDWFVCLVRWAEAIGPLKTAYRISPTGTRKETTNFLSDALFGDGIQSFRNGDYKTAIDHLKEGLTLDPSSAKIKDELVKAWVSYGGKLFTQGNFGEAISAFDKALQLSLTSLTHT